jgi:signal transduction histidine kinase
MSQRSPRFTLFLKIVFGYVVIVLSMAGGSLLILQEWRSLFTSNQSEFQNIQLLQSMTSSLEAEQKTTATILSTRDTVRMRLFHLFHRQFDEYGDSLRNSIDKGVPALRVDSIRSVHADYIVFVESGMRQFATDRNFDSSSFRATEAGYIRDIRKRIDVLSAEELPPLSRALAIFQQQREVVNSTAYAILGLSFLIGFVISVLIAKALTKPINALKAGTQKVGEGRYETVAVTTNDEVADLTLAFNLMSEKLRRLDEMRMELMSEISHEMRTPLQVIKAGCYTVVHTKDAPPLTVQQREAVAMIHQATNRINTFVNSFLDIAKMEAGLMKYNFTPLKISDLLLPLVQEVQLIAQTRQIALTFDAQDVPPILLDKERIGQVFSNLLSNALKYTPEQGTIAVRVRTITDATDGAASSRSFVHVEVQDSGVGIPESDLAKLFDKFYQAKNSPLVNEKGSGLGLALVKHVTEAHGGRVNVQSAPGKGSTFSVEIPVPA